MRDKPTWAATAEEKAAKFRVRWEKEVAANRRRAERKATAKEGSSWRPGYDQVDQG